MITTVTSHLHVTMDAVTTSPTVLHQPIVVPVLPTVTDNENGVRQTLHAAPAASVVVHAVGVVAETVVACINSDCNGTDCSDGVLEMSFVSG